MMEKTSCIQAHYKKHDIFSRNFLDNELYCIIDKQSLLTYLNNQILIKNWLLAARLGASTGQKYSSTSTST